MNHERQIPVGDGAVMSIPGEELEWQLRYGNPAAVRYSAASVVGSYSYLLSLPERELLRRVRIIKKAISAKWPASGHVKTQTIDNNSVVGSANGN
ncbi:MAG TPA: hypothetical protein VK638_47010 [Edaphobacter sp.]|nr:hypothetical protein [Edaphobacter sp.]